MLQESRGVLRMLGSMLEGVRCTCSCEEQDVGFAMHKEQLEEEEGVLTDGDSD